MFNDAPKDYYENGEYDEILFKETIQVLRNEGATVVENIDIPSFIENGAGEFRFMS